MTIERFENGPRFCRVLKYNGIVYLAGFTADDLSGDTTQQTRDILAKIDGYLASVGTNKSRLLSVQIWLQDIDRDFAGLNAAWAEWIPADAMPTRATCEARLAAPDLRVEIIVTAAL